MASFTLSAVLLSLLLATVAQSQHMLKRNSLTVTGTARVSVKTTIALVSLGVEARGLTAAEAQSKLATNSNKLIAYLRSKKVDKLQTTSLNLNAQYKFFPNKPRVLTGYIASTTVSFEVPVPAAGPVIDGSVTNGATQVNSISFKAAKPALRKARAGALREAVSTARYEADVVAMAAGKKIGRILNIFLGSLPSFTPRPFARLASATAEKASTPVVAGDQSVSASVVITYALH